MSNRDTYVPPSNIEAEQATLGSMMLERDALLRAMEILQADEFYRPTHQEVFDTLVVLALRDEPADLITLQEELRKRGKLEDVGGTEYLMALVDSVPTAVNVEHYAGIVKRMSDRRTVIAAATEIIGIAQNDEHSDPVEAFIEKSLALRPSNRDKTVTMLEATNEAWERITNYQDGKPKMGISWGIDRLNKKTYGVMDSDFVLIGGRPSEGKTVLLAQLAVNAAKSGIPVQFFSLEMTAPQIVERIIFAESRIDAGPVKAGQRLSDEEWDRVAKASAVAYNLPIDYPSGETLAAIVASVKRSALKKKAGLVFVDYLQLVRPGRRGNTRNEEIEQIAAGLKELARSIKSPVVAATQLNRSNKRENREPSLQDLRDGGNQEGAADKVILIHNPIPTEQSDDEVRSERRMAKLIVAKHRGGPVGSITVWFNPGSTRFDDCDERFPDVPKQLTKTGGEQSDWVTKSYDS